MPTSLIRHESKCVFESTAAQWGGVHAERNRLDNGAL